MIVNKMAAASLRFRSTCVEGLVKFLTTSRFIPIKLDCQLSMSMHDRKLGNVT